jgi:hypothetical protein
MQGDEMTVRLLIVVLAAGAIAGCSSFWGRKPAAQQQPAANTAAMPAQAAPASASQSSSYMQIPGAADARGAPPMEAGRRINSQPCTREVDLTAGNLKCQ